MPEYDAHTTRTGIKRTLKMLTNMDGVGSCMVDDTPYSNINFTVLGTRLDLPSEGGITLTSAVEEMPLHKPDVVIKYSTAPLRNHKVPSSIIVSKARYPNSFFVFSRAIGT
jgi:hypothetical protein